MVLTEQVGGGRVLAWIRESGDLFGVTLLPDVGPGQSFTSAEGHEGFPTSYDASALLAWGRERWPGKDLTTDPRPSPIPHRRTGLRGTSSQAA